jgi:hypothetical protein
MTTGAGAGFGFGFGAGCGAGTGAGAAVGGAVAAEVSTGAGVATGAAVTTVGIVSTTVAAKVVGTAVAGTSVVGGIVVIGMVLSAVGATDAGRLAAAITVVSPKIADAVIPLAMMRAPIAACGRRVRRVGAGRGLGGGNVFVTGVSIIGSPIGAWPRLARTAAIRCARSWSVIVRIAFVVAVAGEPVVTATVRRIGGLRGGD